MTALQPQTSRGAWGWEEEQTGTEKAEGLGLHRSRSRRIHSHFWPRRSLPTSLWAAPRIPWIPVSACLCRQERGQRCEGDRD